MFTCHGCTRHVLEGTRKCPFCGVTLRASVSPVSGGFVMGAILGLALAGCGDPDPGDEEGATTPNTSNSTATSSATSTATEGQGSTTGQGSTSVVDPTGEAEAADYAGPESEGGFNDSTGTDTGNTTTTDEGEAEGADYAGPEGTGP